MRASSVSPTKRRGSVSSRLSLTSVEESVRDNRRITANTIKRQMELEKHMSRELEDPARIEELKQAGLLSWDDAQKMNAQRIMHNKRAPELEFSEASAAAADFETTEHMLDVVLDDDGSTLLRLLKRALGLNILVKAYQQERKRRADPNFQHRWPCLARIVQSPWFESCMGVLMMVNGVFIGIEASAEEGGKYDYVEHAFTAIFVVELGVRMFVHGWTWVWDVFNAIDFSLIVLTGVLPMWILAPAGVDSSSMRVVQVVRVLRLVRLIRMFRTSKHLRMPYKLTQGLFDSGPTLVHAYAVIGTVLYMLSVFSVYMIGRSVIWGADTVEEQMAQDHFRTVPLAFFTLFQMMTLDSWTAICRRLAKEMPFAWVFFVFVIMLMTLVLQNLITAVIVNNALGRLQKDDDLQVAERREQKEADFSNLRKLFYSMDLNQNRRLTKQEFAEATRFNARVRRRMMGMKILMEEVEEIWDLLDAPPEGIDEAQFCQGMHDMQGDALAKHSFATVHRIRRINRRIDGLKTRLEESRGRVNKIRSEASFVEKDLGGVLLQVQQFVSLASVCVPQDEVLWSSTQIEQERKAVMDKVDKTKKVAIHQPKRLA